MKKTMVSLVAAAALTTGAFAADKGIDIVTTGNAVVFYQTSDSATADFFDENSESTKAIGGIQLDLSADLKNNFTFGAQLTFADTLGLEKNLATTPQMTAGSVTAATQTTDDLALSKIFVAKKIANTTVKIGRQELPKSLSPLAYSESWNAFKNTFDAVVAVNTDIPNTTLVGAYVSASSGFGLGTMDNLNATITLGTLAVNNTAYMLTAQTTVIPMTTLTASYYDLSGVNGALDADAIWIDAQIAPKDAPMGLHIGLQYGDISADTVKDTTAYGLKASIKPMPALTLCAAYTDVNDGYVAVVNTGTGVKSPLFTQMIGNDVVIAQDAETWMLKAAYSLGDMGTVILQGTQTDDTSATANDLTDIELAYKVNAAGVDYFAGYVNRDFDVVNTDDEIIRLWARYNF
ncbi:MAG: hypothetical protein JXQ66_07495 [Campylobacterales bacterium]|nr:hypothetical protein [Campylobacterales bacterium]